MKTCHSDVDKGIFFLSFDADVTGWYFFYVLYFFPPKLRRREGEGLAAFAAVAQLSSFSRPGKKDGDCFAPEGEKKK